MLIAVQRRCFLNYHFLSLARTHAPVFTNDRFGSCSSINVSQQLLVVKQTAICQQQAEAARGADNNGWRMLAQHCLSESETKGVHHYLSYERV